MPSKLPRINVTVSREQHALLLELAKLQGGSASAFLRSMLDKATPLLRTVVPLLRRAAREHQLAGAEAEKMLSVLTKELEGISASAQMELDGLAQDEVRGDGRNAASGSERGRRAPRNQHGKAA